MEPDSTIMLTCYCICSIRQLCKAAEGRHQLIINLQIEQRKGNRLGGKWEKNKAIETALVEDS